MSIFLKNYSSLYGWKYQNARVVTPLTNASTTLLQKKAGNCWNAYASRKVSYCIKAQAPFGNYKIVIENELRQRLCKCTFPCSNVIGVFSSICSNVHLAPKKGCGRFQLRFRWQIFIVHSAICQNNLERKFVDITMTHSPFSCFSSTTPFKCFWKDSREVWEKC